MYMQRPKNKMPTMLKTGEELIPLTETLLIDAMIICKSIAFQTLQFDRTQKRACIALR